MHKYAKQNLEEMHKYAKQNLEKYVYLVII